MPGLVLRWFAPTALLLSVLGVPPVQAEPAIRVSGVVVDTGGLPLGTVKVTVEDPSGQMASQSTITATDGDFAFNVAPGPVHLLLSGPGENGAVPASHGTLVLSTTFDTSTLTDVGEVTMPRTHKVAVDMSSSNGVPLRHFTLSSDAPLGEDWTDRSLVLNDELRLESATYHLLSYSHDDGVAEAWIPDMQNHALPGGHASYTTPERNEYLQDLSTGTSTGTDRYHLVLPDLVTQAPSEVSLTARTSDHSAIVTVFDPQDSGGLPVDTYTITASPGGQSITVAAGTPWDGYEDYRFPELTPWTNYSFTAVATNSAGDSPPSRPSNEITPWAAPDTVTGVIATPGDGRVTLSWKPADGNGAEVMGYYIDNFETGQTLIVGASQTSRVIEGLTNGKTYGFGIRAHNGYALGPPGNAYATPAATPGQPAIKSIHSSTGTATLRWSEPAANGAAITSYVVKVVGTVLRRKTVDGPSAAFRALPAGSYRAYVKAVNAAGSGPFSAPRRFTITR